MKKGTATYITEYGYLSIGYEDDIIIFIKRLKEISGKKTKLTDKVFNQIIEYFQGKRKSFDFKYELRGTEFQKKVWNALLEIPYGETRSYQEIAEMIGNKKASRAVGMANNRNPITIVVPCHRVIGKNGKLVGYFGGVEMKESLINIEKKNT